MSTITATLYCSAKRTSFLTASSSHARSIRQMRLFTAIAPPHASSFSAQTLSSFAITFCKCRILDTCGLKTFFSTILPSSTTAHARPLWRALKSTTRSLLAFIDTTSRLNTSATYSFTAWLLLLLPTQRAASTSLPPSRTRSRIHLTADSDSGNVIVLPRAPPHFLIRNSLFGRSTKTPLLISLSPPNRN